MKLELKHISPYLPYGLKVQGKRHLKKYGVVPVLKVNGISENQGWQYEFIHEDDDLTFAKLGEVGYKPILRSMKDVVKEIEHGDMKFTPAILLAQRAFNAGCNFKIVEPLITDSPRYTYLEYEVKNLNEGMRFLGYDKVNRCSFCFENPSFIDYKDFVQLLEWHFDVFGLIPRGLAVDINELE